MKILSALASVAMSLAYVTLYTSLWDASEIVPYAQIGGAIIIYVMTGAQFLAYMAYRDTSPQHVAADAHAAMRARLETNKLEKQAEAMTDSLTLVDELMTNYRQGIAQQHAHDIVTGLLDMMQYKQDGARELPQHPPSLLATATAVPTAVTASPSSNGTAVPTAVTASPSSNGTAVNFTPRGEG
jgi:hypothetical protein